MAVYKEKSSFYDKTDWSHKRRLRRKRENKSKDRRNRETDRLWKERTTTELSGSDATKDLESIYGSEIGDAVLNAFSEGRTGEFSAGKLEDGKFNELKIDDIGTVAESIQSRRKIKDRLKKGGYAGRGTTDNIFSSKSGGSNWANKAQPNAFGGALGA